VTTGDGLGRLKDVLHHRFQVHRAAPPLGTAQVCVLCFRVLQDNRPWYEGRVAVPTGQEQGGPTWWPTGALVGKLGGMTYLAAEDRPLDPSHECLCNGVN
jgi:hypothetical protein